MSETELLAEQGEVVRTFLLDLLDAFGFDGEVTATPAEEGAVELDVSGEDLGLLIGPKRPDPPGHPGAVSAAPCSARSPARPTPGSGSTSPATASVVVRPSSASCRGSRPRSRPPGSRRPSSP